LAIAVGIAMFVKQAPVDPQGDSDLELEARSWVRSHLADPDAEVTRVTEPYSLGGHQYFAASVREKNVFDGPISNVFFLEVGGRELPGYRPEEMRALVDSTKVKLSAQDAANLESDYRAMCASFGVSPRDETDP
jgi:hypothetical protein